MVLLTYAIPARADEHLLSRETAQAQLNAAATERADGIAAVESLLNAPAALQACEVSGVSVARLKEQLPLLSDEELRELSRRTAELRADPVAGMSAVWKVVIVLVVLFLVLFALAAYAANRL